MNTSTTSSKRKATSPSNSSATKQAKVEPAPGQLRYYHELPHPSTWTFNFRVNDKTGSTMIYVNDANKKKLTFQLPRMRTPFGVRESLATPERQESTSRPNLDLDVDDARLLEWAKTVDTAMIDYIVANSVKLLKCKTPKSREVVEEMFRSIIPPSNNAEYNPLMRTKFVNGSTDWSTQVMVETKPGSETSPLCFRLGTGVEEIAPNDDITAVVDLTGIWLANKNMGMSVSLSSVLVHKKAVKKDFCFLLPPGVTSFEEEVVDTDDVAANNEEAMSMPDDETVEPSDLDPFA